EPAPRLGARGASRGGRVPRPVRRVRVGDEPVRPHLRHARDLRLRLLERVEPDIRDAGAGTAVSCRRDLEDVRTVPRLTKITTKTGDDGTTSLGSGERVGKDALRIEAFGTVDELNSVIGVAIAHGLEPSLASELSRIQNDLFHLGSDLSILGPKAAPKI